MTTTLSRITRRPHPDGMEACVRDTNINVWGLALRPGGCCGRRAGARSSWICRCCSSRNRMAGRIALDLDAGRLSDGHRIGGRHQRREASSSRDWSAPTSSNPLDHTRAPVSAWPIFSRAPMLSDWVVLSILTDTMRSSTPRQRPESIMSPSGAINRAELATKGEEIYQRDVAPGCGPRTRTNSWPSTSNPAALRSARTTTQRRNDCSPTGPRHGFGSFVLDTQRLYRIGRPFAGVAQ
jgi:hypothetical protein